MIFKKKNEFTGSGLYHQQGLIETPGVNWDKKIPSDGVDRDTGGESGHRLKIFFLA